jgi:hypothetical protein
MRLPDVTLLRALTYLFSDTIALALRRNSKIQAIWNMHFANSVTRTLPSIAQIQF